MRRLLFAFLIVLLPLRGWAGDVMAVHMLTQNQGAAIHDATLFVANNVDSLWASGSNDSQDAAQPSGDCHGIHVTGDAPDPTSTAHGECQTCSACQICHTVAVEPGESVTVPLQTAHHAPPGAANTPFASAVLAPGLKPPIS